MTYDDFLVFVAPSCTSCPQPTLVHHIRQAAIDFCARTQVWQEDLDGLIADGFSNYYALALDDQVELSKLLEVWVQDSATARKCEYRLTDVTEGRNAINNGNGCSSIAWTDDRKRVGVYRAPVEGAVIDVTASLKPSVASYSFPTHLFQQHAQDIAYGALCRILKMPRCDWTDLTQAAINSDQFESAIFTASRQQERGFAKQRRDPRSRFM